jgi:hypothetical protein
MGFNSGFKGLISIPFSENSLISSDVYTEGKHLAPLLKAMSYLRSKRESRM